MTRLMILAVIAVVMTVIAVQNPDTTTLTILGDQQTPELPFGLLLVSAFSIGALLSVVLYGLVGLQRPPASKYRPMGRRVPYPDNPVSHYPSSSAPTPDTASFDTAASQSYDRQSGSSAFVSEPSIRESSVREPSVRDASPQDTPPQDTSPSRHSESSQSSFSVFPNDNVANSALDAEVDSAAPKKKRVNSASS